MTDNIEDAEWEDVPNNDPQLSQTKPDQQQTPPPMPHKDDSEGPWKGWVKPALEKILIGVFALVAILIIADTRNVAPETASSVAAMDAPTEDASAGTARMAEEAKTAADAAKSEANAAAKKASEHDAQVEQIKTDIMNDETLTANASNATDCKDQYLQTKIHDMVFDRSKGEVKVLEFTGAKPFDWALTMHAGTGDKVILGCTARMITNSGDVNIYYGVKQTENGTVMIEYQGIN